MRHAVVDIPIDFLPPIVRIGLVGNLGNGSERPDRRLSSSGALFLGNGENPSGRGIDGQRWELRDRALVIT